MISATLTLCAVIFVMVALISMAVGVSAFAKLFAADVETMTSSAASAQDSGNSENARRVARTRAIKSMLLFVACVGGAGLMALVRDVYFST